LTYLDERFPVVTFPSTPSKGTKDYGMTREVASTWRPAGSRGVMGHAAACAVPLTAMTVATLIEGITTKAGSTVDLPVSVGMLDLVAGSPWRDGPPPMLQFPLHQKLWKMLPPSQEEERLPRPRVTPLPFFTLRHLMSGPRVSPSLLLRLHPA
jgi:hypothetical protein